MSTDPAPETRYRKLPIEVDARQLHGSDDGEAGRDLAAWCGGWLAGTYREPKLIVPTLEGDMAARVGDWIVKGVRGEFHPVRGDIFAETYEPAADRAELRDRVAEALISWTYRGKEPDPETGILETVRANAYSRADVVLSVLPTDGRAALDRAADIAESVAESLRKHHEFERSTGALDVMTELRRLAAGERDEQQTQQGGAETLPASTAPLAAGFPLAKGNCPACRSASLFLGTGGYPTCSNHECPEPDAATTVLEQYGNEAHQPEHTWAAELHDPLTEEWAPGTRYAVRERAVDALAHARRLAPTWTDGTPTERRLVRATTTYTVETDAAAPATGQPPADTGEEARQETVHGCPPDGSGLTPCCGRTPFELPLSDRISSEVPVTCKGA